MDSSFFCKIHIICLYSNPLIFKIELLIDIIKNMKEKIVFILLVLFAIGLRHLPYIYMPFEWLETYFHEMSHGLAAIITGGVIDHIELSFDGSGLCYTRGGWRWLVTFSGYAGAVWWGYWLYVGSSTLSTQFSKMLSLGIASLILISALFWVRDGVTLIIITFIISLFVAMVKLHNNDVTQRLLQFSAIYVMISSIRLPLTLLTRDSSIHVGDGQSMANYTGIPVVIWLLIWLAFSLTGLYLAYRYQSKNIH